MRKILMLIISIVICCVFSVSCFADTVNSNNTSINTDTEQAMTEQNSTEFILGIDESLLNQDNKVSQTGIIMVSALIIICFFIFVYIIFNLIRYRKNTIINQQKMYIKPKLIIREGKKSKN